MHYSHPGPLVYMLTLSSWSLQLQFLLPEAQSPQIALTEVCFLDQHSNTPHGRCHSHRHFITFPSFIILPKTCHYLTHLSALCLFSLPSCNEKMAFVCFSARSQYLEHCLLGSRCSMCSLSGWTEMWVQVALGVEGGSDEVERPGEPHANQHGEEETIKVEKVALPNRGCK